MTMEGSEEKSNPSMIEDVDSNILELNKEKDLLAARCESLELRSKSSDEKIKTLEACVFDLIKRVTTTETFEKRINDLESQLNELGSKNFSASESSDAPSNKETNKDEFKEITLERLTALENKMHDIASKMGSAGDYYKDNVTNEKKGSSSVQNAKEETSDSVVTYCQYPPNISGNISVTNEDYMCLGASQFLNDVMIDFFLKYLQFSNNGIVDNELIIKTHIFTTFFYNRLTTRPSTHKGSKVHPIEDNPDLTDSQKMYERVRKWTKRVDLFEKDFIVVPINEKAHWYVCIICYPGEVRDQVLDKDNIAGENQEKVDERKPCILVFDSLPDGSKSDICSTLRSYLSMEWKAKVFGNKTVFTEQNMPQYNPRVRGQKNSKDCGIFLLQYVESFFRTPTRDWADPESDHWDWFHKEEAMKKRGKIAKLIRDLAVKQTYEKKSNRKLVFPPLDFQSVESPFKKSKLFSELKPLRSLSLEERNGDEPKEPVQNIETRNTHSEVKSENLVQSSDTSSRDPRLARGKMVLFHKKGNQVSVSQCKENMKRCAQELDLSAKKLKISN